MHFASMHGQRSPGKCNSARRCAGEFRKFSLSLVESFSFNGIILTVIALDAVLIGIQASGYIAMKSGEL